jgi:hypothetical protein
MARQHREPPRGAAGQHARQILRAREARPDAIFLDDKVKRYIVDLVFATREPAASGSTS